MKEVTNLKHQDPLARLLYEKLKRLPLEELLYLRDELEKIRAQEQRSKLKLIKKRPRTHKSKEG